jgi:hypothetical protein
MMLALGLLAGCAGVGAELERQYLALAQEEYYVKRQSKLWARPDRTSSERGFALQGDRVIKLEGDRRGWSKVRVEGSGLEGWLPAAVLSKKPVSRPHAVPTPPPAKAEQTAPAKSPGAASTSPAAEDKGGSLLSPPAAHAAEPPQEQSEPPEKRKADPKKFEPL